MFFRFETKYRPTQQIFVEEVCAESQEQLETYLNIFDKELVNILSVRAEIPTDFREVNKVLMSCGLSF